MVTVSLDVRQLRNGFKEAEKELALQKHLAKALTVTGVDLTGKMKAAAPRFTGRLANSQAWSVDRERLKLILFNRDARKALWLHEGTKHTKMPPPNALKRWAARVLGDERLAFVVARAILRRGGLRPRKWMSKVLDKNTGAIERRLQKAVDTAVDSVN